MCADLLPPATVRGMEQLDRDAFAKTVRVPHLIIPEATNLNSAARALKQYLLKMEHYKPIRSEERKITLHPIPVKQWEDLPVEPLKELGIEKDCLVWEEIKLSYENYKYDLILKAVLPENQEGLSAFSKIGHIIHLNLKNHLMPYRRLIGEVLMDKVADCRTVVNKSNSIQNTYRNFEMELICGVPEYEVSIKENGCTYKFNFSRVYWNPRLSTEHQKITDMLEEGDLLYDLYAGVGPFTVPAAKRGCTVIANDLNPDSYSALVINCGLNKVMRNVKCYNMDAVDFIKVELRNDLLAKLADDKFQGNIHITMNLPAMAVEHLVHFPGLFSGESIELRIKPLVHVYCFAQGADDKKPIAQQKVEQWLGVEVTDMLKEITFVRNVAPNKDMMRVRNPSALGMAKKANKLKDQPKQLAKKAKNVFAVSQTKKGNLKKTKEVAAKLKKINVQDKREKVDANFKTLHAQIVAKKTPKPAPRPLPAKNKTTPDTNKMETDLTKLEMK
uniref:tRNA (guanine(37)-N(1))-methyltransferase n=2 Tax=Anopheles darlingi TaxID=43151 RepID=TRM5_ANODA|nr:RecName: Full=tRNA (guanine(37)-N1)-methyltransferase; AltName: Full=M1G-methyltransferase; AltName: Full=tRNA [GM37] methyltransferase; AltName: Full=tRNA methyltransferase 5 homolog [Anopheles darlingi]